MKGHKIAKTGRFFHIIFACNLRVTPVRSGRAVPEWGGIFSAIDTVI
jgi:hypothetical protein